MVSIVNSLRSCAPKRRVSSQYSRDNQRSISSGDATQKPSRARCSAGLLSKFMAKGMPEARKSIALAGGLCRLRKSVPLMSRAARVSLASRCCASGDQLWIRTGSPARNPKASGSDTSSGRSRFVKTSRVAGKEWALTHSAKGGRLLRTPTQRMFPSALNERRSGAANLT